MQGFTSTSESFRVALRFANMKNKHTGRKMVLFVTLVKNYNVFNGFRLNDDKFSTHSHEREVLFTEGAPVYVIGTEEVYIENKIKD